MPLVTCSKCGNKIPAQKLVLLTNWNTVTCPKCSSKLKVKNRQVGSLIGGVGGGVGGGLGALLLFMWFWTRNPINLVLLIGLVVIIFFLAWAAVIRFIKVEQEI